MERLEAAMPDTDGVPSAVVRYNPGKERGWLPGMVQQLGWAASLVALVTIDASVEAGAAPTVTVPPLPYHQLSGAQRVILAHAGYKPGPWWITIIGRGWTEALSMPCGESALLVELRRQRNSGMLEHVGEL